MDGNGDGIMKLHLKRLLLLVTVVIMAVFIGGCSNEKVGVVDGSKIYDTPKIQEMQKDLQAKLDEKAKELSTQLEQEKANLSPEDYQKRYVALRTEFNTLQESYQKDILNAVNEAISAVAKEKSISTVLYKDAVVHGGIDITDDVVKKLQ